MRTLQLKIKAETIALGKCDVVTAHPALQTVHAEWDSNERSKIGDNTKQSMQAGIVQVCLQWAGWSEERKESSVLTHRSSTIAFSQ